MCPWQTNSSVCASEPVCVLVLIDVSRLLGERTAGRVRRATTNDRKQMTHFESREWCCQVHAGVAQKLVWLKPSDNPEIVREFETRLLLVVFSVLCLFFERSEFQIDTPQKKNPSVCPCARVFD